MSFSNEDDGKHIVIRLEVKIPHCPTSAPVVISGVPVSPSEKTISPPQTTTAVVSQDSPKQPLPIPSELVPVPLRLSSTNWGHPLTPKASVKVQSGQNMGCVCVVHNGDIEPDGLPDLVLARIIQPQSGIPDPECPPNPAMYTCDAPPMGWSCTIPNSYGQWSFECLDGATCEPGRLNRIIVCRRFSGTWRRLERTFEGKCSSTTDCEDEKAQLAAVPSVPRVWQLSTNGFSGILAGFNGRWALLEQQGDPSKHVWRQGGDGLAQPQIELVGPRCGSCGPFELRFKLAGVNIAYRCRRDQWNMQGLNRFASLSAAQFPANCEIPTSVEVTPG